MQLKTLKTAADLPFSGVEIVKVDSSIKEVIIHGKLHIRADYGMTVSIRTEGEEAKRHRVSASLEGFGDKVEYFTDSYSASTAANKYEAMGAKVETAEITVLVDELGAVIPGSEKDAAKLSTPSDDIAF